LRDNAAFRALWKGDRTFVPAWSYALITQAGTDHQRAIDSALRAIADANTKTEQTFGKQLEALEMRIDDLKDRFAVRQGEQAGANPSMTLGLAIVSAIAAALAAFLAFHGILAKP
jgi:predicted FMN-binding regulatory protein PaiB